LTVPIKGTNQSSDLVLLAGAPGRIRTRDPLLRRQLLYPTELQALRLPIVADKGNTLATLRAGPGYGERIKITLFMHI
jgi:hypothetical protein